MLYLIIFGLRLNFFCLDKNFVCFVETKVINITTNEAKRMEIVGHRIYDDDDDDDKDKGC